MAVGSQHDLDPRPVATHRGDQAPQPLDDLPSGGAAGRAQHGGDHAPLAIEHHDRLEAVLVMMGVEQAELLAAMNSVERVVDIEHDPTRHLAEAFAVMVDHDAAHAQQGARVGMVLQARDRRLRAQVGMLRQAIHGELEHRSAAQRAGVVAVLIAGRDHQHAKADDAVQAMQDATRRPPVADAAGQASRDPEPQLNLAQGQQAAIGGHQPAIETGLDRLAAHR